MTDRKPVFVLSNTRTEIPLHLADKASLVRGDVAQVVKELNTRGYETLYVDGGKAIQEFLRQDLIDEMTITFVSVILGGGTPLFGNSGVTRRFQLIKTEMLSEHLVKQTYIRS